MRGNALTRPHIQAHCRDCMRALSMLPARKSFTSLPTFCIRGKCNNVWQYEFINLLKPTQSVASIFVANPDGYKICIRHLEIRNKFARTYACMCVEAEN